jgi:hypothetical protein
MNTAMTLSADETRRMRTNVQSNILPLKLLSFSFPFWGKCRRQKGQGAWGGLLSAALIAFVLMIGCGGSGSGSGSSNTKNSGENNAGTPEQTLTAREQTIFNVFGRLNLDENPNEDLNFWTDGVVYYAPSFTNQDDFDAKPRATGDMIFMYGGTLHEGGYEVTFLLDDDGNMKVAADDYSHHSKGDKVEHTIIGDDTFLVFKDARTGEVKDVLKKFDGNLYDKTIADIFRYVLTGKFKRNSGGSDEIITFNSEKSTASGLFSKGETAFTFFEEFGQAPVSILCFDNGKNYRASRTATGIELTPMRPDEEGYFMEEEYSKPAILLTRIEEQQPDLPSGRFPLASMQVMTTSELSLYAGDPRAVNLNDMRNEILARHGYIVPDDERYAPNYNKVIDKLTEIERINIALIDAFLVELEQMGF